MVLHSHDGSSNRRPACLSVQGTEGGSSILDSATAIGDETGGHITLTLLVLGLQGVHNTKVSCFLSAIFLNLNSFFFSH